MTDRRFTEPSDQCITLEQLRPDYAYVAATMEEKGGYIVVDDEGRELFTLWIPQEPFTD